MIRDIFYRMARAGRGTAENDAVQALLARYLQKRLQGTQLSTLPPPAVIFNSHHQAKVRQTAQRAALSQNGGLARNSSPTSSTSYKDNRKYREDYEDDYEDDLQGFEDSDRSRTRIDLLADRNGNVDYGERQRDLKFVIHVEGIEYHADR
ncbi:hypothetical protein KPH14_010187 [Odynerus spinipes]|uniref:Uncharacterized protein n=1 Tax=Odynerus spinipes TaxID=1348599 RepID=A0AAD9VTI5_9HYME|nr:hypothetical protein KPH14_010187 [Odynerus spinipes]